VGRERLKVGRIDDPIWHEPLVVQPTKAGGNHRMAYVVAVLTVAVGLGALVIARRHSNGLNACSVLSLSSIERAVGVISGPGKAEAPEVGGPPGASDCLYGLAPGPNILVFAAKQDSRSFYDSQQRAASTDGQVHDISQSSYRAFTIDGPQSTFQTFFMLKHGQYLNVVIYNARPGAAGLLAADAANTIP
jgi:hypothetical protein